MEKKKKKERKKDGGEEGKRFTWMRVAFRRLTTARASTALPVPSSTNTGTVLNGASTGANAISKAQI